jgi:hypothetical protein
MLRLNYTKSFNYSISFKNRSISFKIVQKYRLMIFNIVQKLFKFVKNRSKIYLSISINYKLLRHKINKVCVDYFFITASAAFVRKISSKGTKIEWL